MIFSIALLGFVSGEPLCWCFLFAYVEMLQQPVDPITGAIAYLDAMRKIAQPIATHPVYSVMSSWSIVQSGLGNNLKHRGERISTNECRTEQDMILFIRKGYRLLTESDLIYRYCMRFLVRWDNYLSKRERGQPGNSLANVWAPWILTWCEQKKSGVRSSPND